MKQNTGVRKALETIGEGQLKRYEVDFGSGFSVKLTNIGATIMSVAYEDKNGRSADVVCGFDEPENYLKAHPYFGSLCGRYANRIKHGQLTLNGIKYQLPVNDGENHLHGGGGGFHQVLWEELEFRETEHCECILSLLYKSRDGECGYPGNLNVIVEYVIRDHEIEINYNATTDRKTVINLTNHSYFNLSGNFDQRIFDHELTINAQRYLPIDQHSIPIGIFQNVVDTPFDFTSSAKIGQNLRMPHEQLVLAKGIDHCFVIDNPSIDKLREVASLLHKPSGRKMSVFTTEPGIQLYTGNHLNGIVGKRGFNYCANSALCLETQHFPDSPNQDHFPSTVLDVGQCFTSQTIYRFSVVR